MRVSSANPLRKNIVTEWDDVYIRLARQHVLDGYSYGSFCGKYNISSPRWARWTKLQPELLAIQAEYKKALREKSKHKLGWR